MRGSKGPRILALGALWRMGDRRDEGRTFSVALLVLLLGPMILGCGVDRVRWR